MGKLPLKNIFFLSFCKYKIAGFTLIELLIAIFIGSIVTSILLTLVVQLLQTDQQESTRNNTQSEMQAALSYITDDLREAVYVYDGECLQGRQDDPSTLVDEYCPGIVNHISILANNVPVLAFWKLQPLPSQCAPSNTVNQSTCQPFQLAGRTYSLIVYFLAKNQANEEWKGKARITRYTLDQFSLATNGNLSLTPGYFNPTTSGTSFRTWPRSKQANGTWSNLQAQLPAASPIDTLVDFVDFSGNDPEPCDPNSNNGYIASPSSATLGTSFAGVRSFYACVRSAGSSQSNQQNQQSGLNQDIVVYLRGNTSNKQSSNNSGFLLPLQTQILGRGVIDKQPQSLQ